MINLKYRYSKCPICNLENTTIFKGFSSRHSLMPTKLGIYMLKCFDKICKNCGVIFSNPTPETKSINTYYKNKFTNPSLKPDYNIANQVDFIKKIASKKDKILEIGSNNNYLVKLMSSKGYEIFGRDPIANKKGKSTMKFSIILMNHVLEHIPSPKKILKELRLILNENGLIAIEVPNLTEYQIDNTLTLSCEHLVHYTKETLINLLNKSGYSFVFEEKKLLSRKASIRLIFQNNIKNSFNKLKNKKYNKNKKNFLLALKSYKKNNQIVQYWANKIINQKVKNIYFWGCNIIFLNLFSIIRNEKKKNFFLVDENFSKIRILKLSKNKKIKVLNPNMILKNKRLSKKFVICATTWSKVISSRILSFGYKKEDILIPRF